MEAELPQLHARGGDHRFPGLTCSCCPGVFPALRTLSPLFHSYTKSETSPGGPALQCKSWGLQGCCPTSWNQGRGSSGLRRTGCFFEQLPDAFPSELMVTVPSQPVALVSSLPIVHWPLKTPSTVLRQERSSGCLPCVLLSSSGCVAQNAWLRSSWQVQAPGEEQVLWPTSALNSPVLVPSTPGIACLQGFWKLSLRAL